MFARILTLGDQAATGGVFVVRDPNTVPAVTLRSDDGGISGSVPIPAFIDVKLFPGEIVDMTDQDLFDQLRKQKLIEEVLMKDLPKDERHPTRPLRFTDADAAKEFKKRYHHTRNHVVVNAVMDALKEEYPLDPKTQLPKCKPWDEGPSANDMVELEDIE